VPENHRLHRGSDQPRLPLLKYHLAMRSEYLIKTTEPETKEQHMKPSLKSISIGLTILVLAALLAFPQSLWADVNQGRFSLGLGAGVMVPAEDELESGLAAGFTVAYGVLPALDAQFGYSFAQIRDVEAPPDGKLDGMEINSLELGLLYKILPENRIVPYVGAGLGYYITNVDGNTDDLRSNAQQRFEQSLPEDSELDVEAEDILISINKDNVFGGFLMAGVEFFFTNNVSMQLEGRYTWFDPSLTVLVEYAPLDYSNENISGLKGDNAQALVRFKMYF
jgi:opacity protein-like surface antigen